MRSDRGLQLIDDEPAGVVELDVGLWGLGTAFRLQARRSGSDKALEVEKVLRFIAKCPNTVALTGP